MMGIFYKTVFDISCFYAYVSFFFCYMVGYETNVLSYGVFLMAALVLAVSENLKRNGRNVVIIAAMLPAAALLSETTTIGRIEVVLVWVYLIYSIKQETYLIYYYHFMEKFKGLLWSLIAPVIFVLFDFEKGMTAADMAIPYLIIFLTAGVLTLQTARHRAVAESRKQFEKYQMLQTVVFFIICFLLTLTNLLDMFCSRVLKPAVAMLTTMLFKLVGAAVSAVPRKNIDLSIDVKGFEEAKRQEESADRFVDGSAWAEMINELTSNQEEKDITPLLILLGTILAVILLIVLMSKAAKHSGVAGIPVEREDLPEDVPSQKKVKKGFRNPEATVRRCYREFMQRAETGEQELVKSDTTAEIKEKYKKRVSADEDAAEQITEVYRRIRYGGKAAVKEDAARMKSLVRKI